LDPDGLDAGRILCEYALRFIESHPDFSARYAKFKKVSLDDVVHSLSVTIIAICIAQRLEMKEQVELEKLALACLLHDVGKSDLSIDVFETLKVEFNATQREAYLQHPVKGDELIAGIPNIPKEVRNAILDHHGRLSKISTFSQLVGLSDEI